MFAVAMDCSYDSTAGYVIVALALAFPVWLVAALAWRCVEPLALPRLIAAWSRLLAVLNAEIPAPALVRRLVAAYVAARCRLSASYFERLCLRRAAAEVHPGLTLVEEALSECRDLPRRERLALFASLARFRPSRAVVESARRKCGSSRLIFTHRKSR